MTHLPVEIEHCETAQDAAALMRQHAIHHVPVMNGSHFIGIVAQHDLLESQVRLGDKFSATPLDQICSSNPLVVAPVDPIDVVVRHMLKRETDCATVIDGGFVVGVFTANDALRFIADYCGTPKGFRSFRRTQFGG